ncbi:OsmC family protein [Streptomyces avermitilis]|uniref:OsmC family protein n=1 Tax=Streptomyces avermitilis TaxID=33903 RepID=UPI0033ABC99C
MRNSFNISGSSELVHEVLEDPGEARFAYAAGARHAPGRGLRTWTGPALIGRVKSARRFTVEVDDDGTDARLKDALGEPGSLALALTAVGSCPLYTTIAGGTARDISFDGVELALSATVATRAEGSLATGRVTGLTCEIAATSASGPATLREVVEQVGRHSPVHRTLTDATEVRFFGQAGSGAAHAVAWQRREPDEEPISEHVLRRRVAWLSGTQFTSEAIGEVGAVLRVDQPKQLAGVDWGPNPQEYLLMALAADIARLAGLNQERRTGRSGLWAVNCRAGLDIRGLMNIDPDVAVGLESVTCSVVLPQDGSLAGELGDVRAAAEESCLVDLIAFPHPARIRFAQGTGA